MKRWELSISRTILGPWEREDDGKSIMEGSFLGNPLGFHSYKKYWFSNCKVHVLILPSDVGCMNTSQMVQKTMHWFLGLLWTLHIEPFGGETPHWRRAAVFSIVPSILDVAQVKYSTLQNCGCSANRWFSSGAKTRKKKGARNATFFRANLELQDCRRSQLYDVVHVVKAHRCNTLRV